MGHPLIIQQQSKIFKGKVIRDIRLFGKIWYTQEEIGRYNWG